MRQKSPRAKQTRGKEPEPGRSWKQASGLAGLTIAGGLRDFVAWVWRPDSAVIGADDEMQGMDVGSTQRTHCTSSEGKDFFVPSHFWGKGTG